MTRGWPIALLVLSLATPACTFNVGGLPISDLAVPDLTEPQPMDLSGSDGFVEDLATVDMTAIDLALTPVLSGIQAPYSGGVSLTVEGTIDWAHFGLNDVTDVNRKATGGSQISAAATGTPVRWPSYTPGFGWADGTPQGTVASTHAGLYVSGNGNGFTITVPAGTTQRTLKLYLSASGLVTGSLVAHLSDASAADYTDTFVVASGTSYPSYTITFRAASPGKTLTVTWLITSTNGTNDIDLLAATLF